MVIIWIECKEGHKRVLNMGCWISEREINSAQSIAGEFLGIGGMSLFSVLIFQWKYVKFTINLISTFLE